MADCLSRGRACPASQPNVAAASHRPSACPSLPGASALRRRLPRAHHSSQATRANKSPARVPCGTPRAAGAQPRGTPLGQGPSHPTPQTQKSESPKTFISLPRAVRPLPSVSRTPTLASVLRWHFPEFLRSRATKPSREGRSAEGSEPSAPPGSLGQGWARDRATRLMPKAQTPAGTRRGAESRAGFTSRDRRQGAGSFGSGGTGTGTFKTTNPAARRQALSRGRGARAVFVCLPLNPRPLPSHPPERGDSSGSRCSIPRRTPRSRPFPLEKPQVCAAGGAAHPIAK